MADDKAKPEQLPIDETVQKVDAMMSVSETDGTPAVSTSVDTANFKKAKTAPKLPEVYKPKEPVKPPIVIKLADDKAPEPAVVAPVEPAAANEPVPSSEPGGSANLEDSSIDEAVDDIAAKESDMVLAVEDAQKAKKEKAVVSGPGWQDKLENFFKSKWTWIGAAVVLLVVLAVPFTRYSLLGLFIKKPVTVTVLDSKTGTPVSSAEVDLAGSKVKTDAEGQAHLKAALGKHAITVSKQYYQNLSQSYFVGFKSAKQPAQVKLVATGRLVPITVLNIISGKPVSGALVSVKGTTAKTNAKGLTTVALPTTATTYSAQVSLSGYNSATVTVQVTDQVVKANSFNLTPAGHIYFLSNLSGTIDVVKTNLDGTGRKVVLAGTSHEDANSTSLLASRDWRFLVLKSRRSGSNDTLTLVDTSTDKVAPFDTSDADFNLIGWYGHSFIYDLTKHGQDFWTTGREQLKSYDADNQQLNQLDQTQAEGSASSYAYQNFSSFYIVNGALVYDTQWLTFNEDVSGKTDTIRAVQPDGQNKKDYQSLPAQTTGFIEASLYSPQAVYFAVNDTSAKTTYYDYENQSVKVAPIDNGTFSEPYPTFLLSPSGNQTFWTELRDGKNTLFTGNDNAGNKKQIASSSDYSPYGWFSDNYVLVSKGSSQLYIMPSSGLGSGQQPLKITDYYKPAQTFNGYGYGYGGL